MEEETGSIVGKVEEPIEYNLRGLAHTTIVGDNRLISYMTNKASIELIDIPFVGDVAIQHFNQHGINNAFELYAWIISKRGNLQLCLDGFKEIFKNSAVKYRKILLVILCKMDRIVEIDSPPANWENLMYPRGMKIRENPL